MKIPLSWLKQFVQCDLTPEQISKALTSAGLEVESIETMSCGFEGIVVGKVIQTEKHPNADKLTVAQVTDGKATYQVVCGASNCRAGIKTAFAMIGATLREETGASFEVKKAKLRGVESFGMLCSAKELNLGSDADGIVELPSDLEEGLNLASLYTDTVFDISLTPNLSHCSSILGIARELSAITGSPLISDAKEMRKNANETLQADISVSIEDQKGCPRYACRMVKNVQVKESPAWLQRKLTLAGLRPINNVVDATNYVLMEYGHPLHAFDYGKIEGKKIIVRKAKENELLVTLDGKERLLNTEDLVIADAKRPIALAGVMGGQNSEVSDSTIDVLLEAAYFHPGTIRKTSKRHALMTDASKRFERGTDPNQLIPSLDVAAKLICDIAGGEVVEGVLDKASEVFKEKKVTCRLARVNQLLGTSLSLNEIESIFNRLGMACNSDKQDKIIVSVPTYRVDISQEIDLIEEVARIYSFDNIPKTPSRFHATSMPNAPIYSFEAEMRSRLISAGLQEFLTCDLIGPTLSEIVKDNPMAPEAIVSVLNPTSIEQSILRTSLLPGLLQVIKYNADHQNFDIQGFEIGRIHFKEGERYREQSVAAVILTGKRMPSYWGQKSEELDFFDLKGIVENLLSELKIANVIYKNQGMKTFHDGRQASIFVGDLEIGSLGEIHPAIQRRLDVSQRMLFCEINLHDLMQVKQEEKRMQPLQIYPSSERDWTVTLQDKVSYHEIMHAIKEIPSSLLEHVSLLDIYRSDKIGKDLKNVTFHFVYRDLNKTIDQETVDSEHRRIIESLLSSHLLYTKEFKDRNLDRSESSRG